MRKFLPILALLGVLAGVLAAPQPAEARHRGHFYFGPVYPGFYFGPSYYRPYRYYYGPTYYSYSPRVYHSCRYVRVKRWVRGHWRWRTVRRCW